MCGTSYKRNSPNASFKHAVMTRLQLPLAPQLLAQAGVKNARMELLPTAFRQIRTYKAFKSRLSEQKQKEIKRFRSYITNTNNFHSTGNDKNWQTKIRKCTYILYAIKHVIKIADSMSITNLIPKQTMTSYPITTE